MHAASVSGQRLLAVARLAAGSIELVKQQWGARQHALESCRMGRHPAAAIRAVGALDSAAAATHSPY